MKVARGASGPFIDEPTSPGDQASLRPSPLRGEGEAAFAPTDCDRLFSGPPVRYALCDHLHVVAVTARASTDEDCLSWGGLYYDDLFFQAPHLSWSHVPVRGAHFATPGVLVMDPAEADPSA